MVPSWWIESKCAGAVWADVCQLVLSVWVTFFFVFEQLSELETPFESYCRNVQAFKLLHQTAMLTNSVQEIVEVTHIDGERRKKYLETRSK